MFPGFGILFWLVVRIAVLGAGAWLVIQAVRHRDRGRALVGGGLLTGLLLYASWAGATGVDQWNPVHVTPEALSGTWEAGDSRIEMSPDGTFRVDARGSAAERIYLTRADGRWELQDWNLTIRLETGDVRRLRVVVSNGAYRIIEQPGDLDEWTPWSGFNRTPPSPAPDCAICE